MCDTDFYAIKTNKLSHTIYWKSSDFRYVRLHDIDIPEEKWLNYSGSALFASYPFRGLQSDIRYTERHCLITAMLYACRFYRFPQGGRRIPDQKALTDVKTDPSFHN